MSLLDENVSAIPPTICNNPREKIGPEQVDPGALTSVLKTHKKLINDTQTVPYPKPVGALPRPRHPLKIIWSPDHLYFELNEKPIIRKLWIWNGCERIIYIHCCGLWNEIARLGASWRTYPRTRMHLAPGLKSELCIKVTPKKSSPVPCAYMSLQLAASHKHDNVVGFFCVPVVANFLKYAAPTCNEEG